MQNAKKGMNNKNQMKVISSFSKDELKKNFTDKFLEDVSKEALFKNKIIFKIDNSAKGGKSLIQLKIFSPNNKLPLSSIFPIIDNLGLSVMDIATFETNVHQSEIEKKLYIYYVSTEPKPKLGKITFNNKLRLNLEEGLEKIWNGTMENDSFNSLIFYTSINYREANLLRAYAKYLKQINFEFNPKCILDVLLKHPNLIRDIVKLFNIRFDPNLNYTVAIEKRVLTTITAQLSKISVFDDDKILSAYLNLILATKRTNFFVTDQNGQYRDFISLKIYSKEIENMPLPKPEIDTFVYSAKIEAIHLRKGKIARGGIRWADSLEDFRKVILDLMKTQMTKNAIIVPLGCKGGFVVKQGSESREDYFKLGTECYKNFLRGILDITDNIVNEKVIPPKNVVRHDEDDPYFVVAADKGTATFSDFANEISKEYSFWLGDAFASGGSAGYNHKKMGITAKGTWVCVQEHFKKIPINPDEDVFTAVGIGDMSGDVFGNGMLLSKKVKLLAAFNHIHIFLDPNPDPEISFKERKRLFEKPGSKWSDYNNELISKGGGVYDRPVKSIPISSEVKEALDITENHLSPSELIKAILKAPVDLLWNGGVGTYVKGEDEKDGDIGDRANDNLRVLGQQLRCKVVGEGGNLGFTQRGRIEYAKKDGRINTDFVDNSGGVDCSDHEVNIKIALEHEMQTGNITLGERNKILTQLEKEVEGLVLQDNHKQSMILNMEFYANINGLKEHAWLIDYLEKKEGLQRKTESLPTQKEIERMSVEEKYLTRPETAVLIAYAKNSIAKILNSHDFTKDAFFQNILLSYFPKYLQENFREAILSHKLNNEIIITIISNKFVNTLGCTTFHLLMEEGRYDPVMIIKAFYVIMESMNANNYIKCLLHKASKSFDDYAKNYEALKWYKDTISKTIRWFLMNYSEINEIDAMITPYKKGLDELSLPIPHFMEYYHLKMVKIQSLVEKPISDIARAYIAITEKLHIDKILELTNENKNYDYMKRLANDYIENELGKITINLVLKQLKKKDEKELNFLKDTEKLEQFRNFVIKTIAKKDGKNNFALMYLLISKLKELLQMDCINHGQNS